MNTNFDLEKKITNLFHEFENKNYELVINKIHEIINKNIKIPIIYNLLGVSYSLINEHNKAIKAYKSALELDPENEELFRNLAKSYAKVDQDDQAYDSFKKAIKIKPNNSDAYFGIGSIYLKKKKFNESILNFKLAIDNNKNFFQAYYNMAIAYSHLGNFIDSQKNYIQAIDINENYFQSYNNLAAILIKNKQTNEAIKFLKKALAIKPNYIEALTNLGVAYLDQKKFDYAIEFFNKALELNPKYVKSLSQKLYVMRKVCDWSENKFLLNNLSLINNSNIDVTPWQLLSLDDDAKIEYERAKKFGQQFIYTEFKKIYQNDKIKLAYFTSDFYEHAGMMNMEGIFKYHNKSKFEIYGFDYANPHNDDTHKRIKKYFDKFFYVKNLSDEEVRNLAKENKIDIAIHRNGYSQNSRNSLFAKKFAPLQISFLGYPGTMGAPFIDYIIGDKIVIPDEHKKYFSEKIIYLPNTYYPTYNERKISKTIYAKKNFGIDEDAFVFGSFNNSYKISVIEFSLWMKLLDKIKNSFLILLIDDEFTKKNLLREINKYSIDLKRVKFLNFINIEEHLARHKLIDLYLDTFNYNGHTSSIDALFSGVPVITKKGNSFTARVCASILNSFEMPEMITSTEDEYFKLALDIATNKEKFLKLKSSVMNNIKSSSLFKTQNYVTHLEKGFTIALKNKIRDNAIDHIIIEDKYK